MRRIVLKCEEIERLQILERYLTGKLSEVEEAEFEKHYLGCARCFEDLQLSHAVALSVTQDVGPAGRQAAGPMSIIWSSKAFRWAVGIAAVLILLFIPFGFLDSDQSLVEEQQMAMEKDALLQQLTAIDDVPPYLAATIRGDSESEVRQWFREAMDSYTRQDYVSAARLLEQVTNLEPESRPATFYLGISYLMTERPGEAATALNEIVSQGGGAYEEESRWYFAKALFRQRKLDEGKAQLTALVDIGGLFKEDAERDLKLLNEYLQKGLE